MLSNISRSKSNQAMKFGQLLKYKKSKFFFKNYAENKRRRLVPELFSFFQKALYEVIGNGLQLSFNIFR